MVPSFKYVVVLVCEVEITELKKKRVIGTGWGIDFREIGETYRVLIKWLQNDCVNGVTRKWLAEEGQ